MSSTIKIAYGTPASLTFPGINSLASGSQDVSSAVDNTTLLADDYSVEITIAEIAESGNAQVIVYALSSVDGSTFSDTALPNMARVGFIDLTGTGPQTMSLRSIANVFGGVVPPYFKIVVYNDAGASLASSGNSGRVLPVTWTAS